ncbi:Protein DEK [Camellia lanceoleosa]|uniref:Protein DEK n=1 Tax=Camellia lanceoleosa TaxID=1840588 RepID=A0ACC0HZA4_9ERIC|nr:Protein DEK [Camellia lanceoleosa]
MASETLEEAKQDDIANVEDKEEAKEEEDEEEIEAEVKESGDTEMAAEEEEEPEESKEKEEEEEVSKEVKRGRKGGSKKAAKVKKSEKRLKEPVTPIDRPSRERKTVERYSEPSTGRSASKGLSIEKGRGTQLKDIANVAFKLSKRKPDDNLQILHTILFGKKTKAHSLKRNIGQFSGYVWVENEEKQRARVKEKIDRCVKEKLLDFCDVLNIPINRGNVKKEELSTKLLEFWESPHPTTDTFLADKEQKGKNRKEKAPTSRIASSREASEEASVKKRKQTPQVGVKRKRSSKTEEEEVDDKVEPSDTKNESQDDDDNDTIPNEESEHEESKSEEVEEEDEPKEQMPIEKKSSKKNVKKDSGAKTSAKSISAKKGTPEKSVKSPSKSTKKSSSSTSKKGTTDADGTSGPSSKPKVSATKRQMVEKKSGDQSASAKEKVKSKKQPSKSSSNVSAKDQGKGKASKKSKPEPSKEEMHAVVVDILKEVDFNTATLSDILRQLGTHFGVDLMHRKAEVKAIITDVINSMSDEEDDGDEADSGDDAEKDEDNDNDA